MSSCDWPKDIDSVMTGKVDASGRARAELMHRLLLATRLSLFVFRVSDVVPTSPRGGGSNSVGVLLCCPKA